MMYVFVSGPYSDDQAENVRIAVTHAEYIRKAGLVPVVPHLCHLWDLVSSHEYDYWMSLSLAWLERCDMVYKISSSPGADIEEERARKLGIPVFHLLTDLISYAGEEMEERC